MLAVVETIHTSHASAIVYLVVLEVDACRLAAASAEATVLTHLGIDDRAEEGETREESQDRSYRTNRITISSAISPSQNHHDDEGYRSDDKSRKTLDPNIRRIERIAVHVLSDESQEVVAPTIEWSQEVGGDATI